jgi:hypothetical protein
MDTNSVEVSVIRSKIFVVRHVPVMLDIDVAALYGVSLTDFLNLVAKDAALPADFLLRLQPDELPHTKASRDSFLYALTESGLLMMPALFVEEEYVGRNIALLRAIKEFYSYQLKVIESDSRLN